MESRAKPIAIIHTAFLGDLLLSVAFFKRLKNLFPNSKIHFVCRVGLGDVFKRLNLIDEYYEISKGNSRSYKEALIKMKGLEFDCIFAPHTSFRTALFVSQLKAKKKISYSNFWNFIFYNFRAHRNLSLPEPIRVLQLLEPLDSDLKEKLLSVKDVDFYSTTKNNILLPPPRWTSISCYEELKKSEHLVDTKNKRHDLPKDYFVIFPGSVWHTKKWPAKKFTELLIKLSNIKSVLLLGGKEEYQLCSEIKSMGSISTHQVLNLAGELSLIEVLTLLTKASVVISNDSAGSHLAAVANAPVISIFGPTVPKFGYRPWSHLSGVVQTEGLFCRPCGPHGHKTCPIGTHECMKKIETQNVYDAIIRLETLSH